MRIIPESTMITLNTNFKDGISPNTSQARRTVVGGCAEATTATCDGRILSNSQIHKK
jgi:hypothetical protein